SFFAIFCAAMVYWTAAGLVRRGAARSTLSHAASLSAGAALLAAACIAALPWTPADVPVPPVEVVRAHDGWPILRPLKGDQCWAYLPCSPYPVGNVDVVRDGRW